MKNLFVLIIVLTGVAVFAAIPASLFEHLEFLRDDFQIENDKQIGYWIYADLNPDGTYSHVKATGEGVTCVDDVARTAILYSREIQRGNDDEFFIRRAGEALDFVIAMSLPTGEYYNFVYENGSINKNGITSRPGANWWAVRAMWATALGVNVFKDIDKEYSNLLLEKTEKTYKLLKKSIQNNLLNGYSDISSVFLIACCELYKNNNEEDILNTISLLAKGLIENAENSYSNFGLIDEGKEYFNWHSWGSRQIEALSMASSIMNDEKLFIKTYDIFKKLNNFVISSGPIYRFWNRIDSYPQLAYGMEAYVNSAYSLHQTSIFYGDSEREEETAIITKIFMSWFEGMNILKVKMVGDKGQGYDGLELTHINRNAGAESTISYLLALSASEDLAEEYSDYFSGENLILNHSLVIESEKFEWGLSPIEVLQNSSYSGSAALSLEGSSGIKMNINLAPFSYNVYGAFGKNDYTGKVSISIKSGSNKTKNSAYISSEDILYLGSITGTGKNEKFSVGFSYDSDDSIILDQIIIIPEITAIYLDKKDNTIFISSLEEFLKEENGKVYEAEKDKIEVKNETRISYKEYGEYKLLQLDDIYNNDGFASIHNRTKGNFDNMQGVLGAAYPLEELEKSLSINELMKSGDENNYSSISLLFNNNAPFIIEIGDMNNFRLQNQTISFDPFIASEVYILGSSNHGNYSSEIKIIYEDDTYQEKILGFSDWCSGPSFGEITAKEFPFRYESNGNKQNIICYLYIQKINIPEGKVKGLIFSESINTHVFSISLK